MTEACLCVCARRFFNLRPKPQQLNGEVGGVKIRGVAEKIGSLFGEKGREIGKVIDKATETITIKFDDYDK